MTPLRATHPCPSCGAGVQLQARFCGLCGTAMPEQPERAAALRAQLSLFASRLRATDLLPTALVDALQGLGAAPVRPRPGVVLIGELGRGCRALANRLAGAPLLRSGPSQRGAPACLDHAPDSVPTGSLLHRCTIEIAPPLAAGTDTTTHGVIPTLMRADVVVFALSASQLLSATERRLLTSIAALTNAPIALAVGHMNAMETEDDLEDTVQRTDRFRSTLTPPPEVFLLPADTDDAPQLQSWIEQQLGQVHQQSGQAWDQRALHLLAAVEAVLAAADAGPEDIPSLNELTEQLLLAHQTAAKSARSTLEAGLDTLRSALAERLEEMSPEERVHEGASELVLATESLLRVAANTWQTELTQALDRAQLLSAALHAPRDGAAPPEEVTGSAPKLPPRMPDQSYGLVAAAVGLSVGVLMLPAGGSGVVAMGLGLSAGSVAVARVLRGRRDHQLKELHRDALDGWLREVGVRAEDWLVDHMEHAHEQIAAHLTTLHQHASVHHAQTRPAALRDMWTQLQDQLRGT